jgi:hypothetical protein
MAPPGEPIAEHSEISGKMSAVERRARLYIERNVSVPRVVVAWIGDVARVRIEIEAMARLQQRSAEEEVRRRHASGGIPDQPVHR